MGLLKTLFGNIYHRIKLFLIKNNLTKAIKSKRTTLLLFLFTEFHIFLGEMPDLFKVKVNGTAHLPYWGTLNYHSKACLTGRCPI